MDSTKGCEKLLALNSVSILDTDVYALSILEIEIIILAHSFSENHFRRFFRSASRQ